MLTDLIHEYVGKLNSLVDNFAEEELKPYFVEIFDFLEKQELGALSEEMTNAAIPGVVAAFNAGFAGRIPTITASLVKSFSDPRTAIFVINVMSSQLQTAYRKFLDIYAGALGDRPTDQQELPMTITAVEALLKEHSPSICE